DLFKARHPLQAPMMGDTPIFRSSHAVMPLQAADMYAWWVRHWQQDHLLGPEMAESMYWWTRHKPTPMSHMLTTRSQLRARLRDLRFFRSGAIAGKGQPSLTKYGANGIR